MGKITGFLDYPRVNKPSRSVEERIKDFDEFHEEFDEITQKEQASRCMNCGVPFCQSALKFNNRNVGCPLSNLIPETNHLLYLGLYEEAYKRLAAVAPFPEFTGRVCPALCEAACSCSINYESVNIKANEMFIIEKAFEEGYIKPNRKIKRNHLKAAVIGSGPAGLACAKRLNDAGYLVTVYEKEDRFGGLLMYGIPNMKIDKSIIERRIKLLTEEGIIFVNNTYVGKDYPLDKLLKNHDEVIFSCGTSEPRRLNLPNSGIDGVVYAVDFLKETTKNLLDGKEFSYQLKGKSVVVIGGGDTGNDCVATSLRLGATSITELEIMKEPPLENTLPWPNFPNKKKTDYGIEEANTTLGHEIRRYQTTIKEIIGKDHIESVVIKRVEFSDGKFIDIPDSEETIPCDLLIVSMGFLGTSEEDLSSYKMDGENHRIKLDGFSYSEKISVCGDMKNGQSLVVSAIKDGLDCADSIIAKHLK
ncbi:MAG: glutamate synthase subunit beta [Bacilli bacterium]|nr:glutamate synthase subunit beta [Bacilli bacterium]